MVLYYPVEYVHLTRTVPESRRKLERRTVTPGWVPPTAQGFLRELNRNELIARVEPCGTFCPHPEGYVFVAFGVFFYFCFAPPRSHFGYASCFWVSPKVRQAQDDTLGVRRIEDADYFSN